MINRDEIEAGDKVYTRDGGCLVARKDALGMVWIGTNYIDEECHWGSDGKYKLAPMPHPLDIIRIEKAPKPVVKEIWLCSLNGVEWSMQMHPETVSPHPHIIKLTIINGKLDKAEQMK